MTLLRYLPLALVALLVTVAAGGMAQNWTDGNATNDEDVGQEAPGDGDGDDGAAVWIWVLVIGAVILVAVVLIVASAQNRERL